MDQYDLPCVEPLAAPAPRPKPPMRLARQPGVAADILQLLVVRPDGLSIDRLLQAVRIMQQRQVARKILHERLTVLRRAGLLAPSPGMRAPVMLTAAGRAHAGLYNPAGVKAAR